MNTKFKCFILLSLVVSSNVCLILSLYSTESNYYSVSVLQNDFKANKKILQSSNNLISNVIVFFNKPTYNNTVKTNFTYCGGTIKTEWNNTFNSISGFAGSLPTENITVYQTFIPSASIETDEIIETQMNYASLQSGAVNSSWYINKLKGNTNSSIAVLDTGINPNQVFFPNGYNPTNLSGTVVGWENFVNSEPISDDNGHGTFISSIIAGTGKQHYNSSMPSTIKVYGNYSQTELFGNNYTAPMNFTLKLCSFNVSKLNSNIFVNSSWDLQEPGIDKFWIQLYNQSQLVNYSLNLNTKQYYTINHSISKSKTGIYDIYLKYHKQILYQPIFSFNISVSFYPEFYTKNYSYFTGIANGTKIVSYKILNQSGIGYSSNLISALARVIQNRNTNHIVSVCLSIGAMGEDISAVSAIIDEVIKSGILVVIAAGNSGVKGSDQLNKLAQNKNAIVVGATNDKDEITSYSSMGKDIGNGVIKPDIVAPGGSGIQSHRSIIGADSKSNETSAAYGSSIATAIVTAAINLLIEAKWTNWDQWNTINITEWVKIIKSTLLMTASETNLNREDDPTTSDVDESDYSPSNYLRLPRLGSIKDIHEGYGRLNIQTAIDALTKYMNISVQENGSLVSSVINPLGNHAFARHIDFEANNQYLINMTDVSGSANLDIYLFSNESNQYGEPILIDSSRKIYGDYNYLYFTPQENETACVLVVKAITGASAFKLNVTSIVNDYAPKLSVPEVIYASGAKNTTIMSYQEYIGNEPDKNYTVDRYLFFIEYTDNDTSNVPPQEVYVSIIETGTNYTLTQFNPTDANYTDGTLYWSAQIQFSVPKTYHYFFFASDGLHSARYPLAGSLSINIEAPPTEDFPYEYKPGVVLPATWKITGTGWDIITQANYYDNRIRVSTNPITWNTIYFGIHPVNPIVGYTYQSAIISDPYPDGSLTTPLIDLLNLSKNTQPIAKFGLRISINSLDFVRLQINVNWSGWTDLITYTNQEREWYLEEINLTQYKNNYVQFRFETALNALFDPIKNNGVMMDYFAVENHTNKQIPQIFTFGTLETEGRAVITPTSGSKFERFTFSCQYYDPDNNYPKFVYIEVGGKNYTMLNIYGDWNSNISTAPNNRGIIFSKSLIIGDLANRSFRFHASDDGKHIYTTVWWNKNDEYITITNPSLLELNEYQSGIAIGREFENDSLEEYFIAGNPTPDEATAWLAGDNTWHPIAFLGEQWLYGGIGQISYGANNLGYGLNWDAKLITRPIQLENEHNTYLKFGFNISLQPEVPPLYYGTNPDRCIVSISTNYGSTWTILQEFRPNSPTLQGIVSIDISEYADNPIMVMFTLHSNGVTTAFGYGWLLCNVYIGYDKATDFIAPTIDITNPEDMVTVSEVVTIEAEISDDRALDTDRFQLYINDENVEKEDLTFDSDSGVLSYEWDTTTIEDGMYEILIVAFDEEGNRVEASIVIYVDNGVFNWDKWGPWIIGIIVAVVIGVILFLIAEKKGKGWVKNYKEAKVEKSRLQEIDKDQAKKQIEIIELEEELKRSLTLYCKFCNSWFSSNKFDIMCPVCEHDKVFAAYNCINCGKWEFTDKPGEDYYCPKCTPVDKVRSQKRFKRFRKKEKVINEKAGVRLIRREREEVEEILAKEGKLLREFEIKKKKVGILDL